MDHNQFLSIQIPSIIGSPHPLNWSPKKSSAVAAIASGDTPREIRIADQRDGILIPTAAANYRFETIPPGVGEPSTTIEEKTLETC